MKKSTRNIIIATTSAAMVAAGAVGATLAISRVLINVAVKRKMNVFKVPSRVQDRLTGGMLSDPNSKIIMQGKEVAEYLKTETVAIKSHDGLNLTGHFYPAEHPKRIVIAMHGWRSSWQLDFGCAIDFYHKNGCSILFPDQRGQNDSDGEYIGFGVLERYDCLAWVNYISERFGNDIPIYLLGVSMGATTVLMTGGFSLPDNVKGIIADCGFTSPQSIWEHVIKNNLKLSAKITYPIANAICKKEAQYDGAEYSTIEALAENEKPVLFIHGSDDSFVPIDMTFVNYKACTAPKELLIVPGAGHGMSFVTDEKAYSKAVKDFFHKCEISGFND